MLQQALTLLDCGLSVVPVATGTKCPSVPWVEYQKRLPTNEELEAWFPRGFQGGLGIVTGRVSHLAVLDVDPKNGGEASASLLGWLPKVPTVRTGGGGSHYYFVYTDVSGSLRNSAGRLPGIDIRADGGFVVAPPTKHPTTGEPYRWVSGDFGPEALVPLPAEIFTFGRSPHTGRRSDGRAARRGYSLYPTDLPSAKNGNRNDCAARLVGTLIAKGVDRERVEHIMLLWNAGNRPPLGNEELLAVIDSIHRTARRTYEAPKEDTKPAAGTI